MTERPLEEEIYQQMLAILGIALRAAQLKRLCRVVAGIIQASSLAPAQIAASLAANGTSAAQAESQERQVRRYANDPCVTAECSFHPFARHHLLLGKAKTLLLVLDPTTQADRVVMVMVSIWYRGAALPLAWTLWPGNQPLEGARFWVRIAQLLTAVQCLLPPALRVTVLADRAFGTPAFTDLVVEHGWDYVVRVQAQTHLRPRHGAECAVQTLVTTPDARKKLAAQVFKKYNWRWATLVAYWGKRHKQPLFLVSSLPPAWVLIKLYKRRFPIEALFRDYKTDGWHFEQAQVAQLDHLQRLLIAAAFATWVTLLSGSAFAQTCLTQPPSGKRRTRPYLAKFSLFAHGLHQLRRSARPLRLADAWLDFQTQLNWSDQLAFLHRRAFVFSC